MLFDTYNILHFIYIMMYRTGWHFPYMGWLADNILKDRRFLNNDTNPANTLSQCWFNVGPPSTTSANIIPLGDMIQKAEISNQI